MKFTMVLKSFQDIEEIKNDLNRKIDNTLKGNLFNWDIANIEFTKTYNIQVFKQTKSAEKKEQLPDGTIQYYIEKNTQYYTGDDSQKELQVIELSIIDPGLFGSSDNFSEADKNKIRNFMNTNTYALIVFEGIKTKSAILKLLKEKGFVDTNIERIITREVKPIKIKETDPKTGEEKETIKYETISYVKPSEVKTSTNQKIDWEMILQDYGIYIGIGILALIFILKK